MAIALARRAARHRADGGLQHLPHLERLSRPVREPRHRQPHHRQAAPDGDPAAGHHRRDRPRAAVGSRLRSQRDPARGGGARRRDRQGAGAARGDRARRLHRLGHVRALAARECQGPRLHRGIGRDPVVVTGTNDFKGLCRNLAFSLSAPTAARCAPRPRTSFVPKGRHPETDGATRASTRSPRAIGRGGSDKLLGDPARARRRLAASARSGRTPPRERIERGEGGASAAWCAPRPRSRAWTRSAAATPLLIAVEAGDRDAYIGGSASARSASSWRSSTRKRRRCASRSRACREEGRHHGRDLRHRRGDPLTRPRRASRRWARTCRAT